MVGPKESEDVNFIRDYIEYASTMPEVPSLYNRWGAVLAVGVSLGKNIFLQRGHFQVSPNLYVMLIGAPGTGKGIACSILQSILWDSGYRTFAADRSSKEKFIQDLADGFDFAKPNGMDTDGYESLDFGEGRKYSECFILAEEFNDFLGTNNIEFIALLTKLWSHRSPYRYRLKTGVSVEAPEPCINILGGNTHAGFTMVFPPEIVGQGFLARLLPVYGESTGNRVSFPKPPNQVIRSTLAKLLGTVRDRIVGEMLMEKEAEELLDEINQTWNGFKDDLRFQHYCSRRFTQLLKLCIIFAAARTSKLISKSDVMEANTLLCDTEDVMQKALGEFGKAKNADVSSKIMQAIYEGINTGSSPSTQSLWKLVSNDLDSMPELAKILQNLQSADKIQYAQKEKVWLPKTIARKRNERHTLAATVVPITKKPTQGV
jgi:hypothetical protein